MKIKHILKEAANPKVGRKYQHIEDLVLSDGSNGAMHAIERLKHMGEEGGSIELKWDGMPVVYWGRDEAGNFSLIPKNAWAYLKSGKTETSSGASTVMRSPEDIQAFVLGTGGGDPKARQQFANQFASLWPYFEKISPKQGYLEGGLLFYPGNKPDGTSAMPVLNKETNTYDFTPNITTFHIPVDSELGRQIPKSKVMVAATGYFATMGSSEEQRFPNAQQLSVPGIIVQGTTYVQEPVVMDTQGLANMEAFVKKNAQLIDGYLAPKPGVSNPGGELYSYLNKHLRTEGLLADFPDWANSNLSPKKAQTLLADPKGLQATLGAVEGITKQKNILIDQLSQGLHGGIKQTKPEGYAQAHPGKQFKYDLPGQFVKTIDQTNWAPKESVVNEATDGKKAVLGWGRGMGHTGHDALVKAVIHQAESTGATPYFVVSRSFGKDDPIPPETKLALYQKKFPKYAEMFSLPSLDAPTLNDVLAGLASKGYSDITLVVGADQKEAFGYLTRPDKSGIAPYKKFGLNSLTVMSRQDTKAPGSDPASPDYHEGPRATPMREVLLDPNKSEQEQFAVWRQAMSPSLDDQEVLQMMNTAKENLAKFNMPKPKGRKLKEFIERIKPLLEHATVEQKTKIYKQLIETKRQLNELGEPSSNNLANTVALLINSKKPSIFLRYGDEKVMNAVIDVCTNNPGKTEMELAIEALTKLKKGLTEGFGLPYPGTYEQTNDMFKSKGSHRTYALTTEDEFDEGAEEALQYATQAHAGQTRSGGDPYITHPIRVADHIKQYKQSHNLDALISAAYLHDTIEDTDTTHEALHDLFGGLVASLVQELTSDPEQIKKMGKAQYLAHKMAAMSSYALVIKLADRLDNVKDITTARTPQWRAKYASETNQILNYIEKTRALSGTHQQLISLIRAKLDELNDQQDVTENRNMCNVCGQTPCNCTYITENEFHPGELDFRGDPVKITPIARKAIARLKNASMDDKMLANDIRNQRDWNDYMKDQSRRGNLKTAESNVTESADYLSEK